EKRPHNIDFYIGQLGLSEIHIKAFRLIPISFLHRFIVRIKNVSEIMDLWQYGIYFSLQNKHVVVEISEAGDKLIIYHSPDAKDLRDFVLDEFLRIKENVPFKLIDGEEDKVRDNF